MANECVVDFYLTSIFHLLTPVNGEFIYISLSPKHCAAGRENFKWDDSASERTTRGGGLAGIGPEQSSGSFHFE